MSVLLPGRRPEPAADVATDTEGRVDGGALQRGLAILEVLVHAARPVGAGDLAAMVGLSPGATQRLLQVLVQSEHVVRDRSRRYCCGPRAYQPLGMYHPLNVLRRDAYEPLRSLRDEVRQTATLVLFVGSQRMVLDLAAADDTMTPFFGTYLKSPLHATSSGKCLLLDLPPSERAALLGQAPYPRLTARTLVEPAALAGDLGVARARGYVAAVDELIDGLSAFAAPIRGTGGRAVGCFVVSGASVQLTAQRAPEIGGLLVRTAALFSYGAQGVKMLAGGFGG